MTVFSTKPVKYHWTLRLEGSREALWPLITDTDRFDRDAGVPKITRSREGKTDEGIPVINAEQSKYGFHFEYTQEPFQWVYPEAFTIRRFYHHGVIKELQVEAQLKALSPESTQLEYLVTVSPRNWFGRVAIPIQIGWLYRQAFIATFTKYAFMTQQSRSWQSSQKKAEFETGGEMRLERLQTQLISLDYEKTTVLPFVDFLRNADNIYLAKLRPYEVAHLLGHDGRKILEICLHATRLGVLNMHWEILCPLCRTTKSESPSLQSLPQQVHCVSCNIDVSTNFENSVELVFALHDTVRKVNRETFCIGGPQHTPHIILQKNVVPGNTMERKFSLEQGRYRIRALGQPGGAFLKIEEGPAGQLHLALHEPWPDQEFISGPALDLKIDNFTPHDQIVLLERLKWNDLAVTAGELFTLQLFRDLFSKEILRPEYQISVGTITILFTDLCGSTALYQQIGDAPAFGQVLAHFEILKKIINKHDGAVVKTIGDAVMAVFKKPVDALMAMTDIDKAIRQGFNQALTIKGSLHSGPAIAVNLNDRLDYFGSTVNLASRLEKFAVGSDLIITEEVYNHPEVGVFLDQKVYSHLSNQKVPLKGFTEEFTIYRIVF